jgi:class 3 adenylate cyclase
VDRDPAGLALAPGRTVLEVRADVHSGEVEREAGNLRGIAVHAVTRVAGVAGAGEVFVSEAAGGLLEGFGLSLEDGGEHELKGLSGPRRLYRLAD